MDNYIGEIRLFAGTYAPNGWALCNGALLSISGNDALYALIGTTYGGDGQTTFGLPNLQGRLPIGQGQGQGLSPRVLGQSTGEEAHTLIGQEMATHNHQAYATTATATALGPGSGVMYGTVTPNGNTYGLYTTTVVTAAPMAPNVIQPTGNNSPHDNTMFTTPITFIIALNGIYPSQS